MIGDQTTSVQEDTCSSCREVVGFVRRLLDTNDVAEVQRNLTDWCQNAGKAVPQKVVSCCHFLRNPRPCAKVVFKSLLKYSDTRNAIYMYHPVFILLPLIFVPSTPVFPLH